MSVNWHPKQFQQKVDEKIRKNLDRASIALVADIKESFGSPSLMPKGQRTPIRKLRMKASTYRSYQHSKAGDPPFVQSGDLSRSITFDSPDKLSRRVGSRMHSDSGGYALHLELGTRIMLARPYLRPALKRMSKKIAKIIAGKA